MTRYFGFVLLAGGGYRILTSLRFLAHPSVIASPFMIGSLVMAAASIAAGIWLIRLDGEHPMVGRILGEPEGNRNDAARQAAPVTGPTSSYLTEAAPPVTVVAAAAAPPATPGVVTTTGPVTRSGLGDWVQITQPGAITFQASFPDLSALMVYVGDQAGQWTQCSPVHPTSGVGSVNLTPGSWYLMIVDPDSRGLTGQLHVWTTPAAAAA